MGLLIARKKIETMEIRGRNPIRGKTVINSKTIEQIINKGNHFRMHTVV